ncbi:hypothetical protein ACTFIZ_012581 [Dictyostelium cf. discoideum]
MNKTVCIIGGGPSSLTSLKSSIECGLLPTAFEKKSTFGGVWSNCENKLPWNSMDTNVSHYSMTFSDFEHQRDQDLFLHHNKVKEYLSNYMNHFDLEKYINYNCNVEKVKQIDNDKWLVQWFNSSKNFLESKEFDFLIVCGGMNNKSRQFPMEPLKGYTGNTRYSKDYKSPNVFFGKRVLVVGKSSSGVQIASELCNSGANSVTIYGKRKMNEWGLSANNWRFKNILKGSGYERDLKDNGVPLDFIAYIRNNVYKMQNLSENEQNIQLNKFFKQLSGNNCNVSEYNNDEKDFDKPFNILFTGIDSYFDNINQGKIKCLPNDIIIQNSNGKSIEFINQSDKSITSEEFDEIIFSTGYHLDYSFFDQEMMNKLTFDPNDNYVPCLLYKFTFSPYVNNLGFVGSFGTPFFTLLELQSRWITYVFSGITQLPPKEVMLDGIDHVKNVRNAKYKTTFPFKDYVVFCDQLAKEINVLPNFEKMKVNQPELYYMCWNSILCSATYRLTGPFAKPKHAEDTIKHYHHVANKFYNLK